MTFNSSNTMGEKVMFLNPKAPTRQPFSWVAEYINGTYLSEFDYVTKQENNFYDIDRNSLVRFGLVGDGVSAYFEVLGGIFKIAGQMITAKYVVGDTAYPIIGRPILYNDIITYKDAEFLFDPKVAGSGYNVITQFNVGYKVKLDFDDVKLNFRAICQIPLQQRARIEFRLVSNVDLDGKLVIYRNNKEVAVIDAPLRAEVGGSINWELR